MNTVNLTQFNFINQLLFTTLLSFFLVSCKSADDQEKIAKAQDCLDAVKTNVSDADLCIAGLESIDSKSAQILVCSGKLLGGGLTTTRIKNAILATKEESASNKALVYMSYLAIDDQARADEAAKFCVKSGSRGLIAISGAVQLGSLFVNQIGFTTTPTEADLINAINNPPFSDGSSDAELGTIAQTVAGSYCNEATKDTDICKELNAATEAGSSAEEIGAALRAALIDGD